MGIKNSVNLVEKSLAILMVMLVQLQLFHFLHKFHSNALPLGRVVLGGNGKLYTKKLLYDQSFFIMKFHYHGKI